MTSDFGAIDSISVPSNIVYVATNGNDARTGTQSQDPVATIAKALELAGLHDTVYIYRTIFKHFNYSRSYSKRTQFMQLKRYKRNTK